MVTGDTNQITPFHTSTLPRAEEGFSRRVTLVYLLCGVSPISSVRSTTEKFGNNSIHHPQPGTVVINLLRFHTKFLSNIGFKNPVLPIWISEIQECIMNILRIW